MFLPLSLLFVGAVLVLNGLWMTGRISDREVIVINFATAAITGAVAALSLVQATTTDDVRGVAMTLLFSVTYLWVALHCLNGTDGRGLGWFSLIVAISVLPEALRTLGTASSFMEIWLGLCWVAWSGLWLMFFFGLALGKPIQSQTALAAIASGVLTAWLPSLVLMYGIQR